MSAEEGKNVIDLKADFEKLQEINTKTDKTNKVRAKLIVDVEAEFYDDEAFDETLRYCVEQNLKDAELKVIDVSLMK